MLSRRVFLVAELYEHAQVIESLSQRPAQIAHAALSEQSDGNFDAQAKRREKEQPNEESNPFLKNISQGTDSDYFQGFLIIGLITFLNASCNPLWHAAFAEGGPSPLLMNAAVSVTALVGLLAGGPFLDSKNDTHEGHR